MYMLSKSKDTVHNKEFKCVLFKFSIDLFVFYFYLFEILDSTKIIFFFEIFIIFETKVFT